MTSSVTKKRKKEKEMQRKCGQENERITRKEKRKVKEFVIDKEKMVSDVDI